ncbi:MAG: ABC transporter ATP-binding protein [Caulobacteraceae bacterium]
MTSAKAILRASLGTPEGDDIFGAFDARVVRRLLGLLRPRRLTLAAAQACALLSVVSQLTIPLAIGRALDSAVAKAPDRFAVWVMVFGAAAATYVVMFFFEPWLSQRLAQRIINGLRRDMFAHLQKVSLSFLDRTHVGRMMARLQGDVGTLQEFLEGTTGVLGDFVTLIGVAVMLLALDVQLAAVTLAALPVMIVLRALWLPYSQKAFRGARDASSAASSALAENINGVRTVQEARREEVNLGLYREKALANFRAQTHAAGVAQIMTPTVDLLSGAALAGVFVLGGEAVLGGRLQVGVLLAFVLYVQRFFEPVRTLSMQYTQAQKAIAAAHRVFELLDVPLTLEAPADAPPLESFEPRVEFRHVAFGYRPDRPVLHDLCFTVEPREVVALVGPTGSGKSSIISLARRFYDPQAGQVLVGGRDVRGYSLESLGRGIGMVLQDPFLFTGTIEENIRYNTEGATREDVVAAARAVRAHEFIERLPEGYDTLLGQRGRNLSMGQRQLVSFARALVADPSILILDEATANIDSFTELAIQQALRTLFAGRTCIVIAHRLATIRDADRILVLDHGRIVEQGSHEALMGIDGLYRRLQLSAHASFDDMANPAA